MKLEFQRSFLKDVQKLRNPEIAKRVKRIIEALEDCDSLATLPNLKQLQGTAGYYRIRLGDYRIGLKAVGDTVQLVRCRHRREIYRGFPPDE